MQHNRKAFFDGIASGHKMDPLIAKNWYDFNNRTVLGEKVYRVVIKGDKVICLLRHTQGGHSRVKLLWEFYWEGSYRYVPTNWFRYFKIQVYGEYVLLCSIIFTILALPINIEKYWNVQDNRRNYFNDYARKIGFDPLIPTNWYSVSAHSILSEKVLPTTIEHLSCT
jgi:hypothetical protein